MGDTTTNAIPTYADVSMAHERIAPYIHRTPVLTAQSLDVRTDAALFFKCENFQKGGAFKARGACNAVFGLGEDRTRAGLVTHSSGNHGLCLSYAGARRGIAVTVVMPHNALSAKKDAVRAYGGGIIECAPTMAGREAAVAQIVAAHKATFVHPFDDARVIAGQGTCAKELFEDVTALDALVLPVGGGGLVSGSCLARGELSPRTRIIAAEPENADDAYRSLKAGQRIVIEAADTIADGLRAPLKDLTWHFVSRYVDDILLAGEEEIIAAMYVIWQRMKIIIEPSSAVAIAVILKHRERFAGKRVGVIISGGNVDLDRLPWMVRYGLPGSKDARDVPSGLPVFGTTC